MKDIFAGKRPVKELSQSALVFSQKRKKSDDSPQLKPSECTTKLWIEEHDETKDMLMEPLGGRWLLFYHKTLLDTKWELAKKLYKENKLENVVSMKVSTAMPNPKSTNPSEGVIAFYVGKLLIADDILTDEEIIIAQGEQLVDLFNYQSKQGKAYYKMEVSPGDQPAEQKRQNYRMTVNCPRIGEKVTN